MLDAITVAKASALNFIDADQRHRNSHLVGDTAAQERQETGVRACVRDPLLAQVAGFAWAALPANPGNITEIEMAASAAEEIANLDALNTALAGFEGRTYSYGGDKFIPRFLFARMRVCGIIPLFDPEGILAKHVDLADLLKADMGAPTPTLNSALAAIGLDVSEQSIPNELLGRSWHDGYEDLTRDQLGVRMQWLITLHFHLIHARNIAVTTRLMIESDAA